MRIPRSLLAIGPAIQTFVILSVVQPVVTFAAVKTGATGPWCAGDDLFDKTKPAVLIGYHFSKAAIDQGRAGFGCYISQLLTQNMPYVILIAVVLVVVSGIQYMLSQGQPAAQGAAKTRIIGILSGVIFYFLLRYLLPLIVGGISL